MATNVWDEALNNGKYVEIVAEEQKVVALTNWKLEQVEKNFDNTKELKWQFVAKCTEEDGQPVEKIFNTISKILLAKLRPIFETKKPTDTVRIMILKIGDGKQTQYSVKELA
jgi:hypothetical protein